MKTFLLVPLCRPGYEFEVSYPNAGSAAIDRRRCPVAVYLRSQGAAELCAGVWCTQDFALAEAWGGRLELTETLGAGSDHCNHERPASSVAKKPGGALECVLAKRVAPSVN